MRIKSFLLLISMLTISTSMLAQSRTGKAENNIDIKKEVRIIDSLRNVKQQLQNDLLTQKLEQAQNVISTQTTIISSYGSIYVVITIIIALITIALPITTYLFGIRPSQKVLDDFDKYAEDKFKAFMQKNKVSGIEMAIDNLISDDPAIQNKAINYLTLHNDIELTEQQILAILDIVKDQTTDPNTVPSLYNIISRRKNDDVKQYFTELLQKSTTNGFALHYALRFFLLYDIAEHLNLISSYIKITSGNFMTVFSLLSQFPGRGLDTIINNKKFLDSIRDQEFDALKNMSSEDLSHYGITSDQFNASYLKKRLAKIDQTGY